MRVEYLTQDGLDDLKVNEKIYKELLLDKTNDRILERLRTNGWLAESNVDCDEINFYMQKDENKGYSRSDCENVEIIYRALGDKLSPSNALDVRFWAGFSLTFCWDYIKFRQSYQFNSDVEPKEIINQFAFTKYNKKRNIFVHCVSRLYWAGRFLYDDKNKENPFWAVKELIGQAFPSNILLMSSYNSLTNKNVCLGIMDALKEFKDKGTDIKRQHFIEAYKYVDSIGGTMLLDCFEREKIKELVTESLKDKIIDEEEIEEEEIE